MALSKCLYGGGRVRSGVPRKAVRAPVLTAALRKPRALRGGGAGCSSAARLSRGLLLRAGEKTSETALASGKTLKMLGRGMSEPPNARCQGKRWDGSQCPRGTQCRACREKQRLQPVLHPGWASASAPSRPCRLPSSARLLVPVPRGGQSMQSLGFRACKVVSS